MQAKQQTMAGSDGSQHLRPIQTTFPVSKSSPTRPAPPRPEDASCSPSGEKIPLKTPKSQTSKSSLRSLFLRSKPSRSSIPKNESSLPAINESQKPGNGSALNSATPSPSRASSPPITIAPTNGTASMTLKESPSNVSLSTAKASKQKPTRPLPSWEPPPLFKAYPQALKYATLPTPNLPAETILRLDAQRRVARDGRTTVDVGVGGVHNKAAPEASSKKKGEKIKKHVRKLSDHINKAEWSRKIYVLVTSGYLLQYSADGSFDRQPEKILELGKNSVAFASDVIPGKHWVLQISQTVEGKNTVAFDTRRTFFSRLGFTDARRATKTMLLVFENPEELASWLTLIRREIDSLGGKEFTPESPSEDPKPDLHRFQSFRVNRNSARFEQPRPPLQQPPVSTPPPQRSNDEPINRYSTVSNSNVSEKAVPRLGSNKQMNRRSIVQRPSTKVSSVSTLGTPTDLDRPRDSSRLSYVSTCGKTVASSPGSSPGATSKTIALNRNAHFESPHEDIRSITVPPAEADVNNALYAHAENDTSSPKIVETRRRSYLGSPITRDPSSRTPNFSLPGFARRYSKSIKSVTASSQHTRDTLQSHKNRPSAPHTTQLTSSSAQTSTVVSTSSQYTKPLPSKSIRQKTPVINEEERASFAFTSSDLRDLRPDSETSTHIRTRRYSSYEASLRSSLLPSEPVPRLPKPSHEIDFLNQTIRDVNLNDGTSTSQHSRELKTEPRSRPFSVQIYSSSTHQLNPGIPLESRPSRSRLPTPSTNTPRSNTSGTSHPPATRGHASTTLSPQRSMPQLSRGPPPAPPPDCPLPQVPSHITPPSNAANGHITQPLRSQPLRRSTERPQNRVSRLIEMEHTNHNHTDLSFPQNNLLYELDSHNEKLKRRQTMAI
ncbi:hypothetical protein VTO42DRAFT_1161 [Malbranchea cinnamomea]